MSEKKSDLVRSYVEQQVIRPARSKGQLEFSIVAGDVHKALRFSHLVPLVCQALRKKEWLHKNGLELKNEIGPPSGLSTTMVFTYRFVSIDANPAPSGLRGLAGIGKDLWKDWGGGEAFLKQERADFQSDHKE
jgi:hypothetical protein